MLEEDTYDDNDDDRRSVTSIATSGFPAHQLESVHSQLPQSPFSASQLFRTDEPFNLFSIAEMGGSGGSRGFGGEDADSNGVGNGGDEEQASVAPFRRRMSDEDKDVLPSNALESFIADSSPQQQASASRSPEQGPQQHTVTFLPFPTQAGDAAQSSIQFPGSNSPEGTDSPRPIDLRSRVSSFATEGDIHTPFLRSRVQSRLGEFTGEAGWRTRRESSA
jgi:1-phosphatidylinositol-3-phosphate 5-kinase